jgi:glyoxylase-like metal-dependent hydrolase (beta-lactamase superfamily II)
MPSIKTFTNNPYQENTYILYDESQQCVIIDPGMYTGTEQNAVVNFINSNNLKPQLLLNTHCHIDHVLGNKFVFDNYGLKPQLHKNELQLLQAIPSYAPQQGFSDYQLSPLPEVFLPETGTIKFGNSELEIIFAPGHSPGHLCFYSKADAFLIGGDVLFYTSIGRTDLPGGNHAQLINSLKNSLMALPNNVVVYAGHGQATQIGFERLNNPYLN